HPGVLRILRTLAYSAGPAASTSATRLTTLHTNAPRCGSIRASWSARATHSPSTQLKPAAWATTSGTSAPTPVATLRNGRRRAKYRHTTDRPSHGTAYENRAPTPSSAPAASAPPAAAQPRRRWLLAQ